MNGLDESVILLDIGSTIIKGFRVDSQWNVMDGVSFPRDFNCPIKDQVEKILSDSIAWKGPSERVRICSSANGGLIVGILGYTESFSMRWASKAALNSGANIRWTSDLETAKISTLSPVDLLILVGGFDGSPTKRQELWIDEVKKLGITFDTLVFAGNASLAEKVLTYWPDGVLAGNVLGNDMRWQGESLSTVIREAYLNDLIHRKGMSGLQRYSETPILPTPKIVQESYQAILNGGAAKQYRYDPLMLIDIGGATTDIFYGGDIIQESSKIVPQLSINRYVFAHLGISASRNSLLLHLSENKRLWDFLRVVEPDCCEQYYLDLKEGVTDWVTNIFLAEACCFLALYDSSNALLGGHGLSLERIAGLVITGGGGQLCDPSRIERILKIFKNCNARVLLDDDYQIWIEGMRQIKKLEN